MATAAGNVGLFWFVWVIPWREFQKMKFLHLKNDGDPWVGGWVTVAGTPRAGAFCTCHCVGGGVASLGSSSEPVLTLGGGDSGSGDHLNRTCPAHLFALSDAWSSGHRGGGGLVKARFSAQVAVSSLWCLLAACGAFCTSLHLAQTCSRRPRPYLPKGKNNEKLVSSTF